MLWLLPMGHRPSVFEGDIFHVAELLLLNSKTYMSRRKFAATLATLSQCIIAMEVTPSPQTIARSNAIRRAFQNETSRQAGLVHLFADVDGGSARQYIRDCWVGPIEKIALTNIHA